MAKKINVEQAEGLVLAHNITRTTPKHEDQLSLARGHIIRSVDIIALSGLGQKHIYVIDNDDDVNEDEAAYRLATAFVGSEVTLSKVDEGCINLLATSHGVLNINIPFLQEINSFDKVVLFTRHNGTACYPNMLLAGTKITPLFIPAADLQQIETLWAC
ncbi:MAG: hypothetical protein FWE97_01385 [Dehalococcoidia bacterium]|nr:hypothetical protein [Dehalococcoidia bacterium]